MYSSTTFEDIRKRAVLRAKEKRARDEDLFTRQSEGSNSVETHSDLVAPFLPLSLSITMRGEVIACADGCTALLDTGSSLIQGPGRLVDNVQNLIGTMPQGSTVKAHAPGSLPVSTHNKDLHSQPLTLSL